MSVNSESSTEANVESPAEDNQALQGLRQLRDEIRLHIHLAGMEAKTKFSGLEADLSQLESAAHATGDSVKNVMGTLLHGFRELRDSLTETKH